MITVVFIFSYDCHNEVTNYC